MNEPEPLNELREAIHHMIACLMKLDPKPDTPEYNLLKNLLKLQADDAATGEKEK